MKKNAVLFSRMALVLFAAVLIFSTSCKKEEDPGEAPELPPESTMVSDFSDFDDGKANLKSLDSSSTDSTKDNWSYSALNVGVWQTILTVTLIVPVAAFQEAFNHDPTWDSQNKEWIWSYDYQTLGGTYTASLHGRVGTNTIKWEMYVSKSGSYSDFLWYEGISQTDKSSGVWTLYKSPDNQVEFLDIEWNRYSDGTADIKYTNVEDGAEGEGGYIFYGTTLQDPDYDAFYDIYNAKEDATVNIKWHRDVKAGKVKSEHHFGDTDWHCWNEDLEDAVCP